MIRKPLAAALCQLLAVSFFTGCFPNKNESSSVPDVSYSQADSLPESASSAESSSREESSPSSEESAAEADSSALSSAEDVVAVTIPADFFNTIPLDTLTATARQLGMENYRTNEDGSVTFFMSETMRRTVADTFSRALHTYSSTLPGNDAWPAVLECTLDDTFTTVTLLVDEDEYTPNHRAIAGALYTPISLYRLFLGEEADDISLTITVKNADKSKTLDTFSYPE